MLNNLDNNKDSEALMCTQCLFIIHYHILIILLDFLTNYSACHNISWPVYYQNRVPFLIQKYRNHSRHNCCFYDGMG